MNDFLEAAGHLHIVSVLADPTTATRRVYCACGWRSEREHSPFDDNLTFLDSQVRAHYAQAKANGWGDWLSIDRRRTKASDDFLKGR